MVKSCNRQKATSSLTDWSQSSTTCMRMILKLQPSPSMISLRSMKRLAKMNIPLWLTQCIRGTLAALTYKLAQTRNTSARWVSAQRRKNHKSSPSRRKFSGKRRPKSTRIVLAALAQISSSSMFRGNQALDRKRAF